MIKFYKQYAQTHPKTEQKSDKIEVVESAVEHFDEEEGAGESLQEGDE